MPWLILFLFGIAVGSFLNVLALRYDGEHFVLSPKKIGGRSHCPHCKKTLRWFELIPVVSWVIQGGRCRRCGQAIGWYYPLVELLSGIIFVVAPSALWIIIFEILLLIAYIDIRLTIIPDELNIALGIAAIAVIAVSATSSTLNQSSFGLYASVFGLQGNIWLNHIVGAIVGGGIFGAIVAATRGRGMGMGDVKLGVPLGLLFGWPDIFIIAIMAFIIGGIFGVALIAGGQKTMKSAVPFGPFLVAASAIAFFAGAPIFDTYFHMLGL